MYIHIHVMYMLYAGMHNMHVFNPSSTVLFFILYYDMPKSKYASM